MTWQIAPPNNDVDSIPTYSQHSFDRRLLLEQIHQLQSHPADIPLIIAGKAVYSDKTFSLIAPHNHSQLLATAHLASPDELQFAIDSALAAHDGWASMDWYHRATIFRKAAHILATGRRYENIAAIMLNQSKTPFEAEIDLAEMVDFLNFNAKFLEEIYALQPNQSPGEQNRFDWRPLEGFVLAIPPFNFYSIGGNLPTAPAMAGNTVLWKPARSVTLANYKIMEALLEAGLPPGVINFVPFDSKEASAVIGHRDFAGLHFTGSYPTLVTIWQEISANLPRYRNFPRIVGETGGKDFIFMHSSADPEQVALNIIRGGFEYQGQKCSAVSRAYIPQSQWAPVKARLLAELGPFAFGDVSTLNYAGGAIIDQKAYQKVVFFIEFARNHPEDYEILAGGTYDDSVGWFVSPTLILAKRPKAKLMEEEIFGPVITIYVYEDAHYQETLRLCDETSPYGLTGAIFAQDRNAIAQAEKVLRYSAGNFYINDKPTGAVVARQPFGGARSSGTNDKAGSKLNLLRWLSPRTIKEIFIAIDDWRRPFMK